jgi:hypothetical protein
MRRRWGLLLLLLCSLVWSAGAWAQGLTEPQYQTLKTDITVTHAAEFATAVADAHYQSITDAYNQTQAPPFWVWRVSLPEKEIYEAVVEGQKWSWQTYKAQTVQDRDSWARMMAPGVVNPSLQQTRDGWLAIFGGQGASQVQVNFLLTLGRRAALRNEALFADISGGAGTTAAPATLTYVGKITYKDVNHALTGAPLN